MIPIKAVNHVGIRITEKSRSVPFYENLGFEFFGDAGFEKGHPIIMRHPSGVVLNLLGPANMPGDTNILMDVDDKYPGITHVALTIDSLEETRAFMEANEIAITGSFSFGNMSAIFICDPDRNVIELDAYSGSADGKDEGDYSEHP